MGYAQALGPPSRRHRPPPARLNWHRRLLPRSSSAGWSACKAAQKATWPAPNQPHPRAPSFALFPPLPLGPRLVPLPLVPLLPPVHPPHTATNRRLRPWCLQQRTSNPTLCLCRCQEPVATRCTRWSCPACCLAWANLSGLTGLGLPCLPHCHQRLCKALHQGCTSDLCQL